MIPGRLSVRAVGDAVAAVHGITFADLVGRRDPLAAEARRVAAYLALRWTGEPSAAIARMLGTASIGAMVRAVELAPGRHPRLQEAAAVLAGIAETLHRLGLSAPNDVDPLSVAHRLLAGRPETVPAEHLRVLAAHVVGLARDHEDPLVGVAGDADTPTETDYAA